MKKRKLSLLLIGMLLLAGCSKKEEVTAEQLLGNPYAAVAESGNFDLTVKITSGDVEKTITGNLQYDKDGLHYKGSDAEYYIIRSNSYVKRYDLNSDTGRWTVKDESSLDTASLSSLGTITSPSLSDWVLTGNSTFDKAGRFGMNIDSVNGDAPLSVKLTFDSTSKRLMRAEYTLLEEQPGGLKAYSLAMGVNGINNTTVVLPDDVKNNALLGSGSESSGLTSSTQSVPDELVGTVEVDRNNASIKDIVDMMDELGIEGTEYQGKYYITTQEFDRIAKELSERQGLTAITSTEEDTSSSNEALSESESTEESESVKESESTSKQESESPSDGSSQTGGETPTQSSGAASSYDDLLSQLESKYPGLLADDYNEEFGTSTTLMLVPDIATNTNTILSYCREWKYADTYTKRGIAVCVDMGYVSFDACVSNGADSGELTSLIEALN